MAFLALPALHGEHTTRPSVVLSAPAGHGRHELEPLSGWCLPAAHGSHAVAAWPMLNRPASADKLGWALVRRAHRSKRRKRRTASLFGRRALDSSVVARPRLGAVHGARLVLEEALAAGPTARAVGLVLKVAGIAGLPTPLRSEQQQQQPTDGTPCKCLVPASLWPSLARRTRRQWPDTCSRTGPWGRDRTATTRMPSAR